MKLLASLLIAKRFLFGQMGKSFLLTQQSNARKSLIGAIFGIGLSLIPIIVVMVVANGMIAGITARIVELSSYHLQIILPQQFSKDNFEQLRAIKNDVKKISTVTNTFLEVQGVGLAAGITARAGITIRAVEQELFTKNPAFANLVNIIDGSLAFDKKTSCIVGKKIAETIGLSVGSTMRVITTQINDNGIISPRVSNFTVSGIVSSGYQELDALWVFIPFEMGYELFSKNASNLLLGIQTTDAYSNLTSTENAIQSTIPTNFRLFSWEELHASHYENLKTTKSLLLLIMFLIVLVASVNVSSALIMLIMEKRKEIAILKSVGASPSGISAIFIFAGFFTGFCGLLIGIPVGLLCAVNINPLIQNLEKTLNLFSKTVYNAFQTSTNASFAPIQLLDPAYYLETIPIVIPFGDIFLIAAGTLILSVIVSFFPALRAGNEKPLVSLRKY